MSQNNMNSVLTKKEMGYLVGLFEGDGYSYYDKKQRPSFFLVIKT